MPTSTAATVTRASSPGLSPATLIGRRISPRGRICAGAATSTLSVRALRSTSNQASPSERPGMRFACASSGRCASATR